MSGTYHKHSVTFVSPGTFFPETTTRPIPEWDTRLAIELSRAICERHGAKPYSFYFATDLTADAVSDGMGGVLRVEPREVKRSCNYFIGGTIESVDEVKARNLPDERILLSNMQGNDYPFVVVNTNSYKSVLPFGETDVIVSPETGEIVERGDAPDRIAYRAAKKAKHAAELEKEMEKYKALDPA